MEFCKPTAYRNLPGPYKRKNRISVEDCNNVHKGYNFSEELTAYIIWPREFSIPESDPMNMKEIKKKVLRMFPKDTSRRLQLELKHLLLSFFSLPHSAHPDTQGPLNTNICLA